MKRLERFLLEKRNFLIIKIIIEIWCLFSALRRLLIRRSTMERFKLKFMNKYWKNPVKVTITTECPQCHELFSRLVYSVEIAPYQALTLCPKCDSDTVIMISKTY